MLLIQKLMFHFTILFVFCGVLGLLGLMLLLVHFAIPIAILTLLCLYWVEGMLVQVYFMILASCT